MQRVEFANRNFPFGKGSTLMAVEARKLRRPMRQIHREHFVAPERLGMQHLIDCLEVDRSDRVAFYAIQKPA